MYKYLLFFTSFLFSQTSILTISSSYDNVLLENVLIYDEDKFLGSTDSNGQFIIKGKHHAIKIIKEDYDDIELSFFELENLNWKIKLNPIKKYYLEDLEIIKSNEDPLKILNKLKESRFKQRTKTPAFYQSNVLFNIEKEILFQFNNILSVSDRLSVNNKDTIIYKGEKIEFINKSLFEIFQIQNKECIVPVKTSIYCSLGEPVLTPIFEGNKSYIYELYEIDKTFLLKFKPKKDNQNLLYEGYFVVDMQDFGILELELSLKESKNNYWNSNSSDFKTKFEYLIHEDNIYFKFKKENNQYFLENSKRNFSCTQIKGNQIGKKFNFNFYNEETLNLNGLDFRSFDYINYKFK